MGSVWYEEVGRGLIRKVKNIVTVAGEEVIVKPRTTSEEGSKVIEEFPCVTFDFYDREEATYRKQNQPVILSIDEDNNSAEMGHPAIPYDLYLQLSFWAKGKTANLDINEMQRHWDGRVERHSLLEVVDTDGEVRYSDMDLLDYTKADIERDGEVVFHRIYSYRVKVELDERDNYTELVVAGREVDTKQNSERRDW